MYVVCMRPPTARLVRAMQVLDALDSAEKVGPPPLSEMFTDGTPPTQPLAHQAVLSILAGAGPPHLLLKGMFDCMSCA